MIVCKFGGSSVADASQILKVKSIIESNPDRRLIVVSALGKRNNDDEKITDLLYRCHNEICNTGKTESFKIIRERYSEVCKSLGINDISTILDEVESEIESGKSSDYVASRGEFLVARMLADFFGAEFIDTADIIILTEDGRVAESTYQKLNARINDKGRYIIPGFYGSDSNGNIKTFSRGGSDITGAIVARSVNAEIYENWTDVEGLLMADPRLVDAPSVVKELTYNEIRELGSIGANVFHEEAVNPVKDYSIPINIRNTNNPKIFGTMILTRRDTSRSPIVGISGKTGYRTIFVEKFMLNRCYGFKEVFLKILKANGIIPEFESMGFDSILFLVPERQFDKIDTALGKIKKELTPEVLEVRHSLSIIGIVGSGISEQTGVATMVFTALSSNNINVRFINYGGSSLTLIVGVDSKNYLDALKYIHRAFEDNIKFRQ